jgi:hypothetical protein
MNQFLKPVAFALFYLPSFFATADTLYCGWSGGVLKVVPDSKFESVELKSSLGDVPKSGTYGVENFEDSLYGKGQRLTLTEKGYVYEFSIFGSKDTQGYILNWRNTSLDNGNQLKGSGVCFVENRNES